jgi:hypothetical protein
LVDLQRKYNNWRHARKGHLASQGMRARDGRFALARVIPISGWQPVHEIADRAVQLIGADLRKAFPDGLDPKADSRITLDVSILLKPGKRHGTVTAV